MSGPSILGVAERLSVRLTRASTVEFQGACPKCGGHDRFSINVRKSVWNCRGCSKGDDTIALARHVTGMSYAEALKFVGDERAVGTATRQPWRTHSQASKTGRPDVAPDQAKIAGALATWRESVNPRNTIAEAYLNLRGLALDEAVAGSALRWHPGKRAMLGLFRSIVTGEPGAVSRTFLTTDARKLDRRFLGPVASAAIMLDEAGETLTVAERIETALTARAFGHGATWAMGSAGANSALPGIVGVKRLRIVVERDVGGASERAAISCLERWRGAGRDVGLILPPLGVSDLNDLVRADQR
jgi:hypothetical protein